MRNLFIILLLSPFVLWSQASGLQALEALVDHTWKAEGAWGDGTSFKQEIRFSFALDSQLVICHTKGYTDAQHKQFGHRNHGIRQYNKTKNRIDFWEYDIFGGVTQGTMHIDGQDLYYRYVYGQSMITELWKYIDDSTYQYIIGDYQDDTWKQIYLDSQWSAVAKTDTEKIYDRMSEALTGQWKAKAWDGQLSESWRLNRQGILEQQAQYDENGIISYEARNRVEIVGEDILLFTWIKDGNPKIFKATSWTKNQIIFQNADYSYPNTLVYQFSEDDQFSRTIRGIENGQAAEYQFLFTRVSSEE